jgi:thiamine-monophosphate kinase
MTRRTERQWVQRLRERFATADPGVALGIGDDAAILAASPEGWAWSVDASVQGVHFDLRYLSLEDIGYRAFQAAASDLAAMGAAPVAALSALILPPELSPAGLDRLTLGQRAASRECECPIVGGNLSRGGELSLTTSVLGSVRRSLTRSGARPGEQLWLVGGVGLSAAGLACLRIGLDAEPRRGSSGIAECVQAWRRPRALLRQGRELASLASSAIDVSDGLASDARQLARASGVRIVVERERLRAALAPALLEASRALRRSALHFALRGGEDYALLATGPRHRRPAWAVAIGWVTRGQGVLLECGDHAAPLSGGFDHLAG